MDRSMIKVSRPPVKCLTRLATVLAASVAMSAALAQPHLALDQDKVSGLRALVETAPPGPNPYTSYLPPDSEVDWAYWAERLRIDARKRHALSAAGKQTVPTINESEPNDTAASANVIVDIGSVPRREAEINVIGRTDLAVPTPLVALPEDEGSIPLATPIVGLSAGQAVRVAGVVGDGPFGSNAAGGGLFSGDFDFYAVTGVQAGQVITVDVDTPLPFADLDSFISIWSATGILFAFNDDDGASFDSFLQFTVPVAGDYFVSIGGFGSFITADPFDSSSGLGPGSEGGYEVTIGLDYLDTDFFAVRLRRGDVFGAHLASGGGSLSLIDPSGTLRVASGQDLSAIYPVESSLPGGSGSGTLAYVIEQPGVYLLRLDGTMDGSYTLELRDRRSPLESGSRGAMQTLFLDFDGATIDAGAIFGRGNSPAVLSPLSSFLSSWGLNASDEDAVIDAIVAAVKENVSRDPRILGLNGDFDNSGIPGEFDIRVLNSRDHADPFGQPNVSRLIVGGTIAELGISTIGIADSIDPGNFATEETGVTLLDLLSGQMPSTVSLNDIPLAPGRNIIELIGIAVGNITAHEAGHYLGNFHTEQFVTAPNIMDQGGNLPGTIGLGIDGVFGTSDDLDVDFGPDVFVPSEGFVGVEDTLNVLAFGDSTPERNRVIIDGCNSRAPNRFLSDDTRIAEQVGLCVMTSRSHDRFEDCVEDLVEELEDARILNDDQAENIEECAEDARIPSLRGGDDDDDD